MQCLCVSKLNLFISIGTSLGRRTEICNFFPNLSFEIKDAAYLRVRLYTSVYGNHEILVFSIALPNMTWLL